MDIIQITHIVSTIVVIILGVGLVFRRNTRIHVPCMLVAFITDFILVLWIEFNLQAVENVAASVQNPRHHELLIFHAVVSLITVILYVILTVLGFQILKGKREKLLLHGKLARVFIVTRLVNYVTSFML